LCSDFLLSGKYAFASLCGSEFRFRLGNVVLCLFTVLLKLVKFLCVTRRNYTSSGDELPTLFVGNVRGKFVTRLKYNNGTVSTPKLYRRTYNVTTHEYLLGKRSRWPRLVNFFFGRFLRLPCSLNRSFGCMQRDPYRLWHDGPRAPVFQNFVFVHTGR
jgi:hypothetical protein